MYWKKSAVAILVIFALSAVIAGTSQAAMWSSSGKGTWAGGTTGTAQARQKSGTTGTLVGKVLGVGFKMTTAGLEAKEGLFIQSGTAAQLTGKLNLTGITIDEPAGCKSASTLETVPLTATAQMGNTEATASGVYVKVAPTSGEVLATIKLTECAAAGSYQAKGALYLKAVNPTGTAAVWQEALSSEVINASQGGSLILGKEPATLTGSIEVALNSEESYSLMGESAPSGSPMWNSSGIGTWAGGVSGAAQIRQKSGTQLTLASKLLGSPSKWTVSGLEAKEGLFIQSGTAARLTGKLNFTGISIDEPAGCKSATTLETVPLTATAQMGNTEATKNSVYMKVAPTSGEVLATISLSGCAAAGSYQLKGSFYLKAVNPTGTAAIWQEAITSGEITSSQGGALTLGKEATTLTGTIEASLASGEFHSLQE